MLNYCIYSSLLIFTFTNEFLITKTKKTIARVLYLHIDAPVKEDQI